MHISQKKETVIISVLLLGILVYGAFLRLYALGNDSYWIDESFTLMQARGIVQHGYPLLDSGFVEWKDLLVPYIIAPFVKFFGFEHAWILRAPSVFFGIASIFVGYHLAVILFSRYAGLIFAFFMATCHWYIAWSQQVRGYSAMIFFILTFFYFCSLYIKTSRSRFIQYAMFALLCGVLAKKFAIILFFPLIAVLIFKRAYRFMFFAGVPLVAIILYSLVHVWNFFGINPFSYYYFYIHDYLWEYYTVFFLLFLIGIALAIKSKREERVIHWVIAIFVFSTLCFFATFVYVSEKRYLLGVTPFLFLYVAFLIDHFMCKTRNSLIFGITTFFVFVGFGLFRHLFVLAPRSHYALEYYTPQPDYNNAYKNIRDMGFGENDHIASANPSLDIIYLGRAEFFLPWSLTGRGDEVNIRKGDEYYSGARNLDGKSEEGIGDRISDFQKNGEDVFVIFDELASRRMDIAMWDAITEAEHKVVVGEDGNDPIYIYHFMNK